MSPLLLPVAWYPGINRIKQEVLEELTGLAEECSVKIWKANRTRWTAYMTPTKVNNQLRLNQICAKQKFFDQWMILKSSPNKEKTLCCAS